MPRSNYQDLLKLIAIIAMITDHIGLYFFPERLELRIIGRYAMPVFVFFAGYNFKNLINLSILFYGSLLYVITVIFVYNAHYFPETNILIPIFLGQLYLHCFSQHWKKLYKGYVHFVCLAILWPFTDRLVDYGSLVPAIMIIGYMARIKSISPYLAAFVVSFVSLLHIVLNFTNFNNVHLFFAVIIVICVYISLGVIKPEKNIGFNLKIISRHSMLIYCVQLMVIQLTWKWYSIG